LEGFVTSAMRAFGRSFFAVSFLLLLIAIGAVFLSISLLRVPVVGWTFDWNYIANNPAPIIGGIIAVWAGLVATVRPRYKNALA
jgi:hypothetical protein